MQAVIDTFSKCFFLSSTPQTMLTLSDVLSTHSHLTLLSVFAAKLKVDYTAFEHTICPPTSRKAIETVWSSIFHL